ncbi:beta-glucosidase [Paenibacillus sinopodophylli]|uniref:beta-glucosidase n=1 Tax=Paenibacillus sinopodophylli TaxID=1837342 RepID=UPI00110C9457|nr:glycoside hydrolase family 3 C-terminal domain-containing protein [Paenibacillus sinopodophylli]
MTGQTVNLNNKTKDIRGLIAQMTLEEKASLCSGESFWMTKAIERLGIPSILLTDGPHGVRKQDGAEADHLGLNGSSPATCFPSAAGLASSWNLELVNRVGEALGKESQAEGVSILLGPAANIKRSPLCGRNFEYFSEDPYLTGEMAIAHINGVQSQGVGTSLKHFAVNNQEHRRMTINAVVDERTLREIYLTGFEMAVKKSQPWTVMSAYNRVNGEYCSENEYLLTDILKKEWGHEGFVVSDWGAVNEAVASVAAGMALEMPASHGIGQKSIIDAVENGQLSEEVLNQSVERLLSVVFKAYANRKSDAVYDQDVHHALARQTAQETMVLLKNDGGILPLAREGKIAVIGALADKVRYQGGGSSHINPTKLDQPLQEMIKAAGSQAEVKYAQGYDLDSDVTVEALIEEAKQLGASSDVVVLFVGLPDRYESEGYDRTHLNLPENQRIVIEQVAAVQPNLVVVLSNGAPIVMPWIGNAKAVLEGYLGGQAFGGAVTDLLFGDANPSGKLAETFPLNQKHNPSHPYFPGEKDQVEYREGIFVGYRYYDSKELEPLFPFGYGLSYTTFEYSDLDISSANITDQESVNVTVSVKNTGQRFGQEVVQLYVRAVNPHVIRPEKELKGFIKVALQAGEEKKVSFTLDKRSFAYYNESLRDWHVESGEYEVMISKSSRDLVLRSSLKVVSTVELQTIFHRNSTLGEIMSNPKTAPLLQRLQGIAPQSEPQPESLSDPSDAVSSDMKKAMIQYMPLRGLLPFTGGAMTEETLNMMLEQFNHAVKKAD